MAERFTKLYELPGGLYAPGAPVLIRAGALLRDNLAKNTVVQMKLYNLSLYAAPFKTLCETESISSVAIQIKYLRIEVTYFK